MIMTTTTMMMMMTTLMTMTMTTVMTDIHHDDIGNDVRITPTALKTLWPIKFQEFVEIRFSIPIAKLKNVALLQMTVRPI